MNGVHRRLSSLLIRQRQFLRESCVSNGGFSAMQVRHGKKVGRRIEVILTENMKHLGKAGEIVDVAPGYARNYLCPQLKAMPAIEKYVALVRENLKFFPPPPIDEEEIESEQQAKDEENKRKEIDKMLRRLDGRRLLLWGIVGTPGSKSPVDKVSLRYKISAKHIAEEVRRQLDIVLTEAHIDLQEELASVGDFEVPINLPPNLPLPGGKERLYLKIRVRRKNRIHNCATQLPKTGTLHPRYVNEDGTLKKVPDQRVRRDRKERPRPT